MGEAVSGQSCVDSAEYAFQAGVPDELWTLLESLMPGGSPRPQGGGICRIDNRSVLASIVFVLMTGCPWRSLPPVFGVSVPTAHRRYVEWSKSGLWERFNQEIINAPSSASARQWADAVRVAAEARAPRPCCGPRGRMRQ
jgi:transposase